MLLSRMIHIVESKYQQQNIPAVILKLVTCTVPILRLPFMALLCWTASRSEARSPMHSYITASEERDKTVTAPDMFYWHPFVFTSML